MLETLRLRCAVPSSEHESGWEMRDYALEVEGQCTVLDVLNRLYQEQDPEIAFHSYCRQGLCAGCLVEVDGRRCLACRTPAHDDMEIRPVLGSSSEDGLGG